MKNILITGENSYIGTSFANYMKEFEEEYTVETISVKGNNWRDKDFSKFDVIYHVAGIVHQKETESNKDLYYQVNYNLTKEIVNKAKESGVKQFIFLSSMSVYGVSSGKIDKLTIPNPTNSYGKSKLLAENYLREIEDENFKVSIVRPPMVYGKKCKGNYQKLRKVVRVIPIFPKIENKRSMISINNLSYFILHIIKKKSSGNFHPQNKELVSTSSLIYEIAKNKKKKVIFIRSANIPLDVLKSISNKISQIYIKSFGTLYYSEEIANNVYCEKFSDSIREAEED